MAYGNYLYYSEASFYHHSFGDFQFRFECDADFGRSICYCDEVDWILKGYLESSAVMLGLL